IRPLFLQHRSQLSLKHRQRVPPFHNHLKPLSPPLQTTPTPPPTIETTNIPPSIPDFTLVFQFNDKVITLEKDVAKLKKDPLHTQVTALVDDHLDSRMGATRENLMNFLSALLNDRITEQVRNQLTRILLKEVSNFTLPVIETMITESLNQILIDKMNSNESYLTALEHRECYDEEPEFKVGKTNTPQGQEEDQGNDDVEPRKESVSRRDWFTKPSQPQEHTDPDWNETRLLRKD
nr:hypothetical protein [Tanacetum cinerariifolium]